MYENPGRSGRSRSDNGGSRQAPLSGPAASLGSFDPPRTIGLPSMPAPPVQGPPVAGPPPMATLPFIPPGPNVPFLPVGGGPGGGLPGPDPRMGGPGAGVPQLPPGIDLAQIMPFLQAMFG